MYEQVDKPKENKSRSVADKISQKHSGSKSTFQFVDNRAEAIAQRKLQKMAHNKSSQLMTIQRKDLTDKQVEKIDKKAWKEALSATTRLRPENQEVEFVNGGQSDIVHAATLIRGRNNERLIVTYYPNNATLPWADPKKRLGVMTALFNHELAYHGNQEAIDNYGTHREDPDDEHRAMYDPQRRDNLLQSTETILEEMGDPQSRIAYINWWVSDIKFHTEDDDQLRPGGRREANKWASENGKRLRKIFGPKPKGGRGR